MSIPARTPATGRRLLRGTSVTLALALLLSVLTSLATPAQAASTTARALLGSVPVRAEGGSTTYDRTLFRHWTDANGDCQNTRAEVLVAESRVTARFTTSSRCTVLSGRWVSLYDGAVWTLASDVDIDHRVALKEAWESGARYWSATDRARFANDLDFGPSLEAITDNLNSAKQDRDPAQWMPPLASNHCHYAARWVQVKYRWKMTVDAAERDALNRVLSGSCGQTAVAIPTRAR